MRRATINTYTLFWKNGDSQLVEGESAAKALTAVGFGAGALAALDFYAEGDARSLWWWDLADRRWVDTKTKDAARESSSDEDELPSTAGRVIIYVESGVVSMVVGNPELEIIVVDADSKIENEDGLPGIDWPSAQTIEELAQLDDDAITAIRKAERS